MTGQFSDKPFIVPVFIAHKGCPHCCVFCDQKAITGSTDLSFNLDSEVIRTAIENFLRYRRPNHTRAEISFYGGTFLGLDPDCIKRLMELAQGYVDKGGVDGLRFSTRPDTINHKTLDLIAPFSVDTIEIGVQSMDDGVLRASLRGHSAEDTRLAFRLLKERGYRIGLQMMTGLPEDDGQKSLDTARAMADLGPDFVRIYPTVVLKQSPLARLYHQGLYRPQNLDESVRLSKELYLIFRKRNIPVIRMGLQASDGLEPDGQILAGPYHPSFGHLVYSALFLDLARRLVNDISMEKDRPATFFVHPANISVVRGLKNSNIQVLKSEFDLGKIQVKPDEALKKDALRLQDSVTSLT